MPDSAPQPSPPWWQVVAIGRNPRRTLIRLAILVVASFITFKFILLPVRLFGPSMEPTYHDRSVNMVNRLSFRFRPPERGDVVGARMSGEHVMVLKRIIGMPGERIAIRGGQVYINGQPLDEPYVKNPARWNYPRDTEDRLLGADEYFLIGDNRTMRAEEHEFGVAHRDRLVGRVLW